MNIKQLAEMEMGEDEQRALSLSPVLISRDDVLAARVILFAGKLLGEDADMEDVLDVLDTARWHLIYAASTMAAGRVLEAAQ